MADSNKSRIVIASVLKPIDDSRLYEKIGLSLANTGKYEIHVIGCDSAHTKRQDILQHPFRPFRRVSLGRFLAPWKILFTTLRLRPEVLIIGTHELLYLAMFLRLVTRCKVIYDVQENYYWNILYTPAFPLLIKPFVALYVRGKELLTARYVDHFLLAEKGYEQELQFPGTRYTLLENKVRKSDTEGSSRGEIKFKPTINLIFSGTLAETTGVFTAVELAVKLHVIDERIRLNIIGFCAQPRVLEKLRLLIKPRPFIKLITQDSPVPHTEIFKFLRTADFGLVTYQISPSTMNSIPTKLYEYLGFKLPVILVNHKPWVAFCLPYSAAVVFDSSDYDPSAIYAGMVQGDFYRTEPAAVYWESEEPALLAAVERVIGNKYI